MSKVPCVAQNRCVEKTPSNELSWCGCKFYWKGALISVTARRFTNN